MQFLVYLTVLMVSVSTVLLEVHWLTSSPPQPKAAIRTAAAMAVPRMDGPNAQLSPIYPTKVDTAQPEQLASVAQQVTANSVAASNTTAQAPQKFIAETTGVTARSEENTSSTANAASKPSNTVTRMAPAAVADTAPSNRCDIQACSSAYKSFRASDCTYQPFGGPRRFCARPPVQRAARDQRNEQGRHTWVRDTQPRDSEQRERPRSYDDDGATDIDGDGQAAVIRRGPPW